MYRCYINPLARAPERKGVDSVGSIRSFFTLTPSALRPAAMNVMHISVTP